MKARELRFEMARRGLKCRQVAALMNISAWRLSRILNGVARPRGCERRRLARVLGVSTREVLFRWRPRRSEQD